MKLFRSTFLIFLLLAMVLPASPAYAADPLLVPPDQQPKDAEVLRALTTAGIDKNYVRLEKDYGKRSEGKSPYVKTWIDLRSGKRVAEISGLPMVDADGVKIEVGWLVAGINYFSEKNNLFRAKVQGTQVEITIRNDQPDGRKANAILSFTPKLFLNNIEVSPISNAPTLLAVDPLNPNYLANTLEWDYGIAKRRLRVIEGSILGSWVFASKPSGEVRIKYNQIGDYKLRLGQFATDNDTEVVKPADFDKLATEFNQGYPVTISDEATFYPDANPETTSVDGYVSNSNAVWATGRGATDGDGSDDSGTVFTSQAEKISGVFYWKRNFLLFDTSSLPDTASITNVVLSLYSSGGYNDTETTYPADLQIVASTPASNTSLSTADFDQLGTTKFLDSAYDLGTFGASAQYHNLTLNAAGRAAISVTGISKYGERANNDFSDSTIPTARSYGIIYSSEQGNGFKPKLVVTYSVPATITLSAASSIEATTATLNGNITAVGDNNPTVTVYWGTTDGGQTPASWSNNSTPTSPAQPQGVAAFYKNVTGLSYDTTYFFSASAVNTGGTSWPSASLSFTTLLPLPLAPTNFTLTETVVGGDWGLSTVSATWTKGAYANTTLVRYNIEKYPASITDGTLAYSGSGISSNISGLDLRINTYYFSAWAYNATGYSIDNAKNNVGGTNMIFLGILGFASIMSFIAFRSNFFGLKLLGGMAWIFFFLYVKGSPPTGMIEGSAVHSAMLVIAIGMAFMIVLAGLGRGIKTTSSKGINGGFSVSNEQEGFHMPDWMKNMTADDLSPEEKKSKLDQSLYDYRMQLRNAYTSSKKKVR